MVGDRAVDIQADSDLVLEKQRSRICTTTDRRCHMVSVKVTAIFAAKQPDTTRVRLTLEVAPPNRQARGGA